MVNPIEKQFSGFRFSEIKNSEIFDKNNEKVGKLQDAIFKKSDDGWHLTKFLVGGSFLEELLEDLRLKSDVDPIFPISTIDSITPKSIKLCVAKNELKSTGVDSDALEKDEVKLSALSKINLVDSQNEKIGNIIDMKFEGDAFQFIVGDGVFKELLEDFGLREDIDFLISPSYITSADSGTVKLSQDKTSLNILFKDSLNPEFKKQVAERDANLKKAGLNAFYPTR